MLSEFIAANNDAILALTRKKVASRPTPRATADEVNHGVPMFLDQIVETLRRTQQGDDAAIGNSASKQGGDQLRQGFTVGQVVHGYGDVCQAVTELAHEKEAPITADEFRTFNRCLDEAIARAVTEYMRQREQTLNEAGTERLGTLAHELRNRLNGALFAFEILKKGNVGVNGATGAVLSRSLVALRDLVDRSFAEVRLELGAQKRERVSLSDFVREVEADGVTTVNVSEVKLTVEPIDPGQFIEIDRQIMVAALGNLVQNALKYTRPGGHVWIRALARGPTTLIEVEDECGGLPPGKPDDLFKAFTQRASDRTGLGLGLTICQKGVEANGGKIGVRDLPGKGCVFWMELPTAAPL